MKQSLLDEIEKQWKDKGWDPALLHDFRMSNVEPDVLAVPGGLDLEPEVTLVPPVPGAPVVEVPTGRTFTEADIAKARQEEKDKLYPNIKKMEEELSEIRKARQTEAEALKEAAKLAADEVKAKAEEEMSAKELLAQREKEWQEKFSSLETARERDLAMLEMERKFASMEQYKTQRLAESADEIMPELRDLVAGSSEEEIENSIATAIAKTNAILANVQQHRQQERQQQRGASITSPPVGPLENDATYETVTADDIRNMDMGTYAKNRQKLLNAASRTDRGLFG